MPRTAPGGLSRHPTKGYRLTIGKKPDGKARLFWLGHDRYMAEWHAQTLKDQFARMKAAGRDTWTPDDMALVGRVVNYISRERDRSAEDLNAARVALAQGCAEFATSERSFKDMFGTAAPVAPSPDEQSDETVMLHALIDRYVTWYEAKADRAYSTKARLREIMTSLKQAHADIAVRAIDRPWLDAVCQFWKNRPPNKQTGRPLSTYTVKTYLQHFQQFFGWAGDNEETTGFVEPKKISKLFKYRPDELDEVEQFTIDEIRALYTSGTDQQRLYLLAGVTCGMTQGELAAAKSDEFDLTASLWLHRRHKTGVAGSHWLCPELAALIRTRIAGTPENAKGLAFLTEEGHELVSYRDGRRVSDAVRQSWDDLLNRAKIGRRPTFKMCRKFLGQWIRDHHGEELAQIALQHKSQTVLSRHYAKTRNFTPLHSAQKQMYAELTAAGVFGS